MTTPEIPEIPEDSPSAPGVPLEAVIIVDRSGSMEQLRGAVVEAINQTVSGLQPHDRVTIVQFDSEGPYDVLVEGVPVAEVTPLQYDDYQPRGGTPLYDAVGRAIAGADDRARQRQILTGEDVPVVVTILTDGFENASREFTAAMIRQLIERFTAEGWTFGYAGIGLGEDAFAEAARMGIGRDAVASFDRSVEGTFSASRAMLNTADLARRGGRGRR